MRFHPTEEQLAIVDAVRGTLADAMPGARRHALVDSDAEFDSASWDALMALGIGGLALPEADGGSGLGLVDLAMIAEALGQDAAVGPTIQHLVATLAVQHGDSSESRETWLGGLASGETVATLAFGGEWLPETWNVEIIDGRASGSVRFVPGASSANLFVVGTDGGGLALVLKSEQVGVAPIRSADRTRRLSSVTFDGAAATLLIPAGDPRIGRLFDAALILIAADALGGAQYCVDLAVDYAKERRQFGQPIGRFQALKHQLATMALEVEPARALLWYAAYAWDAERPDARHAAAIVKAHIADRFVSVARAAIAAHGGIGYTWEFGLNIWLRRSLFDRAYLGSPAVHRSRAADLAGW